MNWLLLHKHEDAFGVPKTILEEYWLYPPHNKFSVVALTIVAKSNKMRMYIDVWGSPIFWYKSSYALKLYFPMPNNLIQRREKNLRLNTTQRIKRNQEIIIQKIRSFRYNSVRYIYMRKWFRNQNKLTWILKF